VGTLAEESPGAWALGGAFAVPVMFGLVEARHQNVSIWQTGPREPPPRALGGSIRRERPSRFMGMAIGGPACLARELAGHIRQIAHATAMHGPARRSEVGGFGRLLPQARWVADLVLCCRSIRRCWRAAGRRAD